VNWFEFECCLGYDIFLRDYVVICRIHLRNHDSSVNVELIYKLESQGSVHGRRIVSCFRRYVKNGPGICCLVDSAGWARFHGVKDRYFILPYVLLCFGRQVYLFDNIFHTMVNTFRVSPV